MKRQTRQTSLAASRTGLAACCSLFLSLSLLPARAHAQDSDERIPTTLSVSGTLLHSGRLPGRTILARVSFHPTGKFDYGLQGGFLASRHLSFNQWPSALGFFGKYYLSTSPKTRYDSYLGEVDLRQRRTYVGFEYLRASDGGDYGGAFLGFQETKYFAELRYLRNTFSGNDFAINLGVILKGW
jgi:hypothetical protein